MVSNLTNLACLGLTTGCKVTPRLGCVHEGGHPHGVWEVMRMCLVDALARISIIPLIQGEIGNASSKVRLQIYSL